MAELRQRRAGPSAAWASDDLHVTAHEPAKRGHLRAVRPRTTAVVLAVVAFYVAALATVAYWHTWLPPPKGEDAPADQFAEGRARRALETIQSFGPRQVGTRANEELVPAFLLSEIEAIKAAASPGVQVEIDVQRPSGAFGINFMSQFQNIYANVTNVLVRVTPPDASEEARNNSLLLSSHYDAAVGGAAASDDGVNIAIMLELLRLAALNPPKHATLVFNFNGAEETIMQGAHGFITSHQWTDSIRAFINLEAAGAGGRELLFQTGSDELALAYAHGAPYPHASIIGQELFQSGVLPADTDYRVYRDFGFVAGMDFAYISNGYVYHTHLDDISRIQPGAVQRLGDNIVGVLEQLANRPGRLEKVAATPHSSNTLFFDVAGVFMITSSKTTAFACSISVLLLVVLYLLASPVALGERVSSLKMMVQCAGTGLFAALAVAALMSLYAPLTWYSQPLLAGALYLSPALAGMLHCLASVVESTPNLWRLEEAMFEAVLLLWAVVLAVMLSVGLISSYIAAIWLAFPLLGQSLSRALQAAGALASTTYLAISLAALTVPVGLTLFTFALAVVFFVPLLGRIGTTVPPDPVLALLLWAMLAVLVAFAGRFFCFVPARRLRTLCNCLIVFTLASVAFASLRNPYTADCPKRVMVQHVQRQVTLENGSVISDAGLWVNPLDFRGLVPMQPFLEGTRWRDSGRHSAPTALREELNIYDDLPFSLPVKHMLPAERSWYLDVMPPTLPSSEPKATLEVLSSKYSEETDRRMIHLRFTGPSHMNLFIDAKASKLTSWSIGDGKQGPVPESEETYILQFCSGVVPTDFHFWLEAESARPIDVVVVGHHMQVVTPEMAEFMDAMPPWFTFASCVSTLEARQI